MDIKEQISRITERIAKDDTLRTLFQKEPIQAVEQVLGVDLPDDVIETVIQGVRAKLSVDKLSGAADVLKKLF